MPMPMTATLDPLAALVERAATAAGKRPVPLVATRFDVTLDGGLAVVETTRRYRNAEHESIEATLTFPLPVQATLFALEARIDGRLLTARAKRRQEARADYESAVERGKAAVLHEELLRGIHMLSVAHVPPGCEIEVVTRWAASLSVVGDRGSLRIPLTVGEVYGRSGLPESDALVHGGTVRTAELLVVCRDGEVALRGGLLQDGRAVVPTDAPIDLEVVGWTSRPLAGRAADGRGVSLAVAPGPVGEVPLDVAILVDRSGSMGSRCSGESAAASTKHQSVVAGLRAAAADLRSGDAIDLWQFDDTLGHVGKSKGPSGLHDLAGRLAPPNGGTEIGQALVKVIAGSSARDLLLITDGKSHALDVQALARAGRRIAVLLVGEDSLEAQVGHLAALTGGESFVAAGADIVMAMLAALASLRRPHRQPKALDRPLSRIEGTRGGALLTATWQTPPVESSVTTRAVAAFAASLALPALDEERAAALAEAEGLVTHLTSLILVDEAGEAQEGLPATRKIALPTPRMAYAAAPMAEAILFEPAAMTMPNPARKAGRPSGPQPPMRQPFALPVGDLAAVAAAIDWSHSPRALKRGDLSSLDPAVAMQIERAARTPAIAEAAGRLGLAPVALVLALLARLRAAGDRAAARLAKDLLRKLSPAEVARLEGLLSLSC